MPYRTNAPQPSDRGAADNKSLLWFLAGVLLTANFALIGYLLTTRGDSSEEVATQRLTQVDDGGEAVTTTDDVAEDEADEPAADDASDAEVATTTTEAAPADTTTTEPPATTTTLQPLAELPERGAVYRDGKLYLEGPVPNQEIAQQFIDRASEVIGADNVINNYVIRADAPIPTDGNVRVEQAVLFETGSAVIAPEFEPILGLGIAVMQLNPQVRMVVEGHTDDVGSDELNLELSLQRAESAIDYMVAAGIDRSRFDAVGYGETQPFTTNETDEGRQINRRIEVQLLDLLVGDE